MSIAIFRPTTDTLLRYRTSNPQYWDYMCKESAYSPAEVFDTLAAVEAANDDWRDLQVVVFNVLTDADGPMDSIHGFASDTHRQISIALATAQGYVYPQYKDNGQDGLPVRKWQNDIKRVRCDIKRITAMIETIIS